MNDFNLQKQSDKGGRLLHHSGKSIYKHFFRRRRVSEIGITASQLWRAQISFGLASYVMVMCNLRRPERQDSSKSEGIL